jgi:hypothetical protein
MDVLAMVTLAVAGAALLLAVLAWRTARDAKSLAAGELPPAAPVVDADAVVTHETGERFDTPAEATRAAPAAGTGAGDLPMLGVLEDESSAMLVVRRGDTPGEALPTNQGSGSGLIGLFVTNAGPGVAHDVQLFAAFPNGTIRASDPQGALASRKEAILFAQVVPQDFGPENAVDIAFRVAYRDGNGDHQLEQGVRVEGGWKGPWKTYFSDDPARAASAPDRAGTGRGRFPPRRRR